MSELINKLIHKDEIKLRILMTDMCNRNCTFCLNDFQNKPINEPLFLDTKIAKDAIDGYVESFINKYPLQVYFSGGEPTLHKDLIKLMKYAKSLGCKVILNTNGNFDNEMERELIGNYDEIHFGTYEINETHAKRVKRMDGNIQSVLSLKDKYITEDFIKFYISMGLKVKIFDDFNGNGDGYIEFAENMHNKFGNSLSYRHTGIQENRGDGCEGCFKKCITLKGAWVFPDGGTSPCPQLFKHDKAYPKNEHEWVDYFYGVCNFHSNRLIK